MFESLPIGFFMVLIFAKVINMDLLYNENDSSASNLFIPFISTILKIIKEFVLIFHESSYLKENVIHYALIQIKGKYNWIPYCELI